MRLPIVETVANQIDVLAQRINEIGETERHVQLTGFVVDGLNALAILCQLACLEMPLELFLDEFEFTVTAENLGANPPRI